MLACDTSSIWGGLLWPWTNLQCDKCATSGSLTRGTMLKGVCARARDWQRERSFSCPETQCKHPAQSLPPAASVTSQTHAARLTEKVVLGKKNPVKHVNLYATISWKTRSHVIVPHVRHHTWLCFARWSHGVDLLPRLSRGDFKGHASSHFCARLPFSFFSFSTHKDHAIESSRPNDKPASL